MSGSQQDALDSIAKSSRLFSSQLYQILSEKPGNVFFSPTSVEVILALTQFGARGQTAQQISSSLALPPNPEVVKAGYNALMTRLKSTDDMVLEIANKIYSEQTFLLEKEFQLVAEKAFLAAAENVDFLNNPEGSRRSINAWVEQQTRDKITNLLPEGEVTPDTKMVLVNAVYFKGLWEYPFDPVMTKPEPFYISPTETKLVDMMHIKKKFGYAELDDLKAKMLVLPYKGEKMHMVILLPNALDGLAEMEKKLNTVDIMNLMGKVDNLEVEVSLPRFKIESTIELKKPLQKLGMVDMFDPIQADFSGFSSQRGLYVSKVIQKAFIEVNEEGSEAAAATASIGRQKRSAAFPQEFIVNHPFVMHLCWVDGSVLLAGRVSYLGTDSPFLRHEEL